MAGFLTAIKEFSHEISAGGKQKEKDTVREIEMETYNVVYEFRSNDGVMSVVAHDKKDDPRIIRGVLTIVVNAFLKQYASEIKNWKGDINQFTEFGEVVDDVLKKGKVAEIYPKLKKKLTPLTLKLGMINESEYKIASKCDGRKTYAEIAEDLDVELEDIYAAVSKLRELGLVEESGPE
jgi:hypothetical protein